MSPGVLAALRDDSRFVVVGSAQDEQEFVRRHHDRIHCQQRQRRLPRVVDSGGRGQNSELFTNKVPGGNPVDGAMTSGSPGRQAMGHAPKGYVIPSRWGSRNRPSGLNASEQRFAPRGE